MTRPNSAIRALRAMTALITLWCLGCSGFEPLLDAALGAGTSIMTCGSGGAPMGAEMSPTPTDRAPSLAAVSAAGAEHRGFDCGCGSCHAAAPSVLAFQPASQSTPAMLTDRIGMPASIVRTPLLPPPQRTA